jgi:transposase
MGAPYSQELRLRVLAAIDKGISKTKAHQQFKVSRSTIDDWLKLREKTGKVEATTEYLRGPAPAIADSPEVRDFIEEHQNSTLGQLAEVWFAAQGQRLSTVTFSKTLKRLGYTRKKRVTSTKNAR